MLRFPVHPRYARMFLAAEAAGCVRDAALVAALAQGRGLLVRGVSREVDQAREDTLGEERTSDFLLQRAAWEEARRCGFELEACRRLGIHAQAARQVGPFARFRDAPGKSRGCARARDEFGHHGADQRKPARNLEAAQKIRQRGRQTQQPQLLPARGAVLAALRLGGLG
jgi:ATP-dependent helicase HrpB